MTTRYQLEHYFPEFGATQTVHVIEYSAEREHVLSRDIEHKCVDIFFGASVYLRQGDIPFSHVNLCFRSWETTAEEIAATERLRQENARFQQTLRDHAAKSKAVEAAPRAGPKKSGLFLATSDGKLTKKAKALRPGRPAVRNIRTTRPPDNAKD